MGLLLCGWIDGPQAFLPWSSNFLWLIAAALLVVGQPKLGWVFSMFGLLFASRVLLPYPGAVLLEAKYWWLGSHVAMATGSTTACVWSWLCDPPRNDSVP
ncbi:hypothetical protein FRUB_07171 [Fimbriiglobus ruber]|uniref:Uncharacterized protein n=1 Tax=Fimbriiglobus ruber TaxID=1908690 RepID=A0A225D913_9BACT|nr:hypothetical protein FRUB_07171 [Fimbriiglobus ruber]